MSIFEYSSIFFDIWIFVNICRYLSIIIEIWIIVNIRIFINTCRYLSIFEYSLIFTNIRWNSLIFECSLILVDIHQYSNVYQYSVIFQYSSKRFEKLCMALCTKSNQSMKLLDRLIKHFYYPAQWWNGV